MISMIAPSRGRPLKSFDTLSKWCRMANGHDFEIIISLDLSDDQTYRYLYPDTKNVRLIINDNRSCVDAINNAAKSATGDIFIVVSDDTDCFEGWNTALLKELEGKSDYLLKTDDGIQDYICTMTVMDRAYFQRDGYIYHPDFFHQFADTYLTCVADIRGRLIKSKLKFPHLHPGHSGGNLKADALNIRNDGSWIQGQETFIRLMKQFTTEERNRIQDQNMKNWLRNYGRI
jgi:glycosyltransferase involved in cell wall biosynthesis